MTTSEEFERRVRDQLDIIASTSQKTPVTGFDMFQVTGLMAFHFAEQGFRATFDLMRYSSLVMFPVLQASVRFSLTGFEVFQNYLREISAVPASQGVSRRAELGVSGVGRSAQPAPGPREVPRSGAPEVPAMRPDVALPAEQPPAMPVHVASVPETDQVAAPPVLKQDIAELDPERSFYFRGSHGQFNFPVNNLTSFVQHMDQVDDDAWLYHLRRGDYANWIRHSVQDSELADIVAQIADEPALPASASRSQVRAAIKQRYAITT